MTVSTHAPTKGATGRRLPQDRHQIVSTHAPAKGATGGRRPRRAAPSRFNPRSREGSDHAVLAERFDLSEFQPTLPRRKRLPGRRRGSWWCACFNPRPREGSDPSRHVPRFPRSGFNPRSREGSDGEDFLRQLTSEKFQPTLPRRERRSSRPVSNASTRFQPTLPRRERRRCRLLHPAREHRFNPRSREGSDSHARGPGHTLQVSTHAPAKGATRSGRQDGT